MDGNLGGHLVFGAMGLPLLVLGFMMARYSFWLRREGVRTSAEVVAYRPTDDCPMPVDDCPKPVVEFEDRSGKRHRVELDCSAGPPVGESMEVLYNRNDPEKVLGKTIAHLWMVPLITTGFGSLLVAQVGQAFGVLDLVMMAMALGVSAIVLAAAWAASWLRGGSIGKKRKGCRADEFGPDLAEPIGG